MACRLARRRRACRHWRWLGGLVAVGLATALPTSAELILEHVPAEGVFAAAGLRTGDVLDRWRVELADGDTWRGRLGTSVDWRYLLDEILPRDQPIRLFGHRPGGDALSVEVAPGPWRVTVRPILDDPTREAYDAGRDAIAAGRSSEGLAIWRRHFDDVVKIDRTIAVWLALRISHGGNPRADDAVVRVVLERAADGAIGVRERTVLIEELVLWELKQGDFGAAEPLLLDALGRHRTAGDPIGIARCLYRLGWAIVRSGDPVRAEPFYNEALEMYREHAPDGLGEAATRIGLGHTNALLGDLRFAEDHWLRSLALYEAQRPAGTERICVLYNLGAVAASLGDLARSERYLFQALDLQSAQGDSLHRARALNNLAEVAMRQGELDRAVEYLDEALRIKREHASDDVMVSTSLANLGHIAMRRDEAERAAAYFAEALAHVRRVQPGTLHEAVVLENSARAALAARQLEVAESRLQAAWAIAERTAPDGPVAVATLHTLAEVAAVAGDLDTAVERFERAVAEIEQSVPGTQSEVEVLGDLADVRIRQGQLNEAAVLLDRALTALENQVRQVGGSPDRRHRFRSAYHRLYRRQVEVLVDLERFTEAFAVVERSRARGLLELFAGRDLRLREVPEDLDRRHRRLVTRYGREIHRLATLDESAERGVVLAELDSLRRQRDEVAESMWRQAPRAAELHYPRPLDPSAARAALPREALLLSWSVGEDRTILFAVRGDEPIRVLILPVGESELDHRIDRFVRWIREPMTGAGGEAGLLQVARRLGDDLLGAVTAEILASERLILSPDGPLHRLPFAALRLDLGDDDERWMVEIRPMSTTPSVTVLDELTRRSKAISPKTPRLAAFGAPLLPSAETQSAAA
ncbi:MAG: tetratricopeptide repeat protein, partial [Acidobacteriota bacterium]